MSIFDKDIRHPDEILYEKCRMACDVIPVCIHKNKLFDEIRAELINALRGMNAYNINPGLFSKDLNGQEIEHEDENSISEIIITPIYSESHISCSFLVSFLRRRKLKLPYFDGLIMNTLDTFAQFTINMNGDIENSQII